MLKHFKLAPEEEATNTNKIQIQIYVSASQVGSGGGSHHPRLALLTLAALHTLAAFLTNYSMSQANPFEVSLRKFERSTR